MKCEWCDTHFEETGAKGYEVHEIAHDVWVVICVPCARATDVGEGK